MRLTQNPAPLSGFRFNRSPYVLATKRLLGLLPMAMGAENSEVLSVEKTKGALTVPVKGVPLAAGSDKLLKVNVANPLAFGVTCTLPRKICPCPGGAPFKVANT